MPFILKTSNLILISDVSVKNDPKGKKKNSYFTQALFSRKRKEKK